MRTPEFPIHLHSPRFVFRDFVETDRVDFVSYQMDARYRMLYGHHDTAETRARSDALFDRFLDWQHAEPRRNFQIGIFDRATQNMLGCTGLRCRDEPARSATFGIELAPSYWGHYRAAIEATALMIAYGFRELDLVTIIGDTASGNKRVARLANWFGAEITAERPGPDWMQHRDWTEIDWTLNRHDWEQSEQKEQKGPNDQEDQDRSSQPYRNDAKTQSTSTTDNRRGEPI